MPAPTAIAGIARRFRDRSLTSVALVRQCLDRIAADNQHLHALAAVDAERALAAAAAADRELADGRDRGPLHGIPFVVMDVIDMAGLPTACGSRLRADHVADADAAVVARLANAGAVPLGKASTFEFATGSPDAVSPFPAARNPWDDRRGAGATGAAAAVAAGFAPLAVAIDTGGAVRASAALCGVVGLKPGFDRISRRGIVPLANSLDHVGPIAATVADAALALTVLAEMPGRPATVETEASGLRVRLLTDGLGGVDRDTAEAIAAAAALLRSRGARVTEATLAAADLFQAAAHTIYLFEAFALHASDLRARPDMYGLAARERLMGGAFVGRIDYENAKNVQRHLAARVDGLLQDCDVLIAPVTGGAAPRLDATAYTAPGTSGGLTIPFNLTGHPALSLCCGFGAAGLPLALQVIGRHLDEATVLRAAAAYETAARWTDRVPQRAAQAAQ